MSDPAWVTTPEINAYEGIVYVQAAGAGAPGTADELGYVTSISESHEPNTTEQRYINYGSTVVNLSTYTHTAELSIRYGEGAQAKRQMFLDAIEDKTRLKVTIIAGPTATGEISVYDQAIVGYTRNGDPGDGWSADITVASNSWTPTAATS
jgi:hypothetical protein